MVSAPLTGPQPAAAKSLLPSVTLLVSLLSYRHAACVTSFTPSRCLSLILHRQPACVTSFIPPRCLRHFFHTVTLPVSPLSTVTLPVSLLSAVTQHVSVLLYRQTQAVYVTSFIPSGTGCLCHFFHIFLKNRSPFKTLSSVPLS